MSRESGEAVGPFRWPRLALLLILSWCVMTFTHEAGHVLCGCFCGGTLVDADLVPWRLPYSFFQPDPCPLVTLWGGPLPGVAGPLVLAFLVKRDWAWFMAWFCVLANGVYLALAWITNDPELDTAKLFQHGASPVAVGVFCLLTIVAGYTGFRRSCRRCLTASGRVPGGEEEVDSGR